MLLAELGHVGPSDFRRAVSRLPRHRKPVDTVSIWIFIVIVVFIALAAFAATTAYQRYHVDDKTTQTAQQDLAKEFSKGVASVPAATSTYEESVPDVAHGGIVGRLEIPSLDSEWIVLEGTTEELLEQAPGHYEGTAMPGQLGNFAVAGHRSSLVFRNINELHADDVIIVETKTHRYTYAVNANYVVDAKAWEVVAADPIGQSSKITKRYLTLTTCDPWYDNTHRLVIHAELIKTERL